jgi:hypothetical protein
MGTLLMQLLLIGGVGWLFYYMFWALGKREMAKLLQLACYCLGIAAAIQLLMGVAAWISSTPVYRFFAWFGRG